MRDHACAAQQCAVPAEGHEQIDVFRGETVRAGHEPRERWFRKELDVILFGHRAHASKRILEPAVTRLADDADPPNTRRA